MKLSLRELFLLTTLVAVALAWWLDRRAILTASKNRLDELIVEINRLQLEAAQRQMAEAQSGWWREYP